MGPAPIRDSLEVIRQWSIPEKLSFLVLGVVGEGKGVVGGGAAEYEERGITEVFADLGVGGSGRGGGSGESTDGGEW